MKNRDLIKNSAFMLRGIIAACVFCIILFSCKKNQKEILTENEYYVCSMDPQVLEKQPGMCPICKMPLAKITLDKSEMQIIRLNDQQMKLANVKVEEVKKTQMGKETSLTGVFTVNSNNTEQISARISGRIEKLYHKTEGEEIKSGEAVYDLHSRELMLAQEEYLFALDKSEILGGKNIVTATKNKLLLWGMKESQIKELERTKQSSIINTIYSNVSGTITEIASREGEAVTEGAKIYELADLSSLWVEAQIYSTELKLLQNGRKVEIIPDAYPEEATEGTIVFVNPELQNESKINLIRMEVKNPGGKLKPGMQAYVIHHSDEKVSIVVPADAVIRDSKSSVVWIQNRDGGFESRKVETGMENKFRIEIVSGIAVGEKVVVSGAYLINSEYVFKRGMMPGDDVKMGQSMEHKH